MNKKNTSGTRFVFGLDTKPMKFKGFKSSGNPFRGAILMQEGGTLNERVVKEARRIAKDNEWVETVPEEITNTVEGQGTEGYTCIGGVCRVLQNVGVMNSPIWSNTEFERRAKEFGLSNPVYGIDNLEPGDVLQWRQHANKEGKYYPTHGQIFLGWKEDGSAEVFDNFNKSIKTYPRERMLEVLSPSIGDKRNKESAQIIKLNPKNIKGLGLTSQQQNEISQNVSISQTPVTYSRKTSSGISPNSPYYYLARQDSRDIVKDNLISLMNNKDLDKSLRETLLIDDSRLQNLKPLVYGIIGQESSFDAPKSLGAELKYIGENTGVTPFFQRTLNQFLESKNEYRPSLGPAQQQLENINKRTAERFGIKTDADLRNLEKSYIAALQTLNDAERYTTNSINNGKRYELKDKDPFIRALYWNNNPYNIVGNSPKDEFDADERAYQYAKAKMPDFDYNPNNLEDNIEMDKFNQLKQDWKKRNLLNIDKGSYPWKVLHQARDLEQNYQLSNPNTIGVLQNVTIKGKKKDDNFIGPRMQKGGTITKDSKLTPEQLTILQAAQKATPTLPKTTPSTSSSKQIVIPKTTQDKNLAYRTEMLEQQKIQAEQDKLDHQQQVSALSAREKGTPFTFPDGTTKTWDKMDFRERGYVTGQGLRNKAKSDQTNPEPAAWYNPVAMLYDMAAGLGEAPYKAKQQDSYTPYLTSIGTPLAAGALGSIGTRTTGQFINNVFSPVGGVDDLFGRKLTRDIKNYGKILRKEGLDDFTIAQKQMEKFGITENQRKAYVPLVSDFASKFITPFSYDLNQNTNFFKRVLTNKGWDTEIKNRSPEIFRQRADSWDLYLGRPQSNNTFSLSKTSPINHPSYNSEQLKNMDIYNLNKGNIDIRDDVEKSIYNFTHHIKDNKFGDLINGKPVIYNHRPVMGGYNSRLTDNYKNIQYNDIWDLDVPIKPADFVGNFKNTKLGERLLYTKKDERLIPKGVNFKVDKFLGKPFMSHGNVRLNIDNDEFKFLDDQLNKFKEEYDPLFVHKDLADNAISTLESKIKLLKDKGLYRKGGPIISSRGQWDYPGMETIVPTQDGRITMKGVNYPLLGIDETGDTKVMFPNREYQFTGKTVYEKPLVRNPYKMQQGGFSLEDAYKFLFDDEEETNAPVTAPSESELEELKQEQFLAGQKEAAKKYAKELRKMKNNQAVMQLINDNPELNFDNYISGQNQNKNQSSLNLPKAPSNISFDYSGKELQGNTIAARHNNPGNLKFASWMSQFGAVPGDPGTDGGRFAKFPSVQKAMEARQYLLRNRPLYTNKTVDEAMSMYSNKGYNGNIYPEIRNKKMSELTQDEFDELTRRQIIREDTRVAKQLGFMQIGGTYDVDIPTLLELKRKGYKYKII